MLRRKFRLIKSWLGSPKYLPLDLPKNVPSPKFRLFQKVRLKGDDDADVLVICGVTWLADSREPAWFYAWGDGVELSHEDCFELVEPEPRSQSISANQRQRNCPRARLSRLKEIVGA